MGKVFFTCFHHLLLREKPSSDSTIADDHHHEAIQVFENSIVADLQKLQGSLAANFPSLGWCSDVVNLLRKMHFHLLCLVQKSQASMLLYDGVNDFIEEYMKETLVLLDLCNYLKSAISEMQRYRLVTDFAAKKLHDDLSSNGFLSSIKIKEVERLERESTKLYSNTEKHRDLSKYLIKLQEMQKPKSKDVNVRVVYAVKGTINVLCQILVATILVPVSIKADYVRILHSNFPPQLKLFSDSLMELICSFNEGLLDHGTINKNNCPIRPVLVENKMVERRVFDIKEDALRGIAIDEEEYRKIIDSLVNKCVALKEGLEMFEYAVSELFEEVIKGRNKVLGMIISAA